jgi:hypothetical protein
MSETLNGNCLCGEVTVTMPREGATSAICHCRHCQKQTGSAFSTVLIAAADAVVVNGTLADYEDTNDKREAVIRRFCPKCGSPVETRSGATEGSGIRVIKAGLMKEGAIAPHLEVFCDSKLPWVNAQPGTICFPKMPPTT